MRFYKETFNRPYRYKVRDYGDSFQAEFRTDDGREGVVDIVINDSARGFLTSDATFNIEGSMTPTGDGDAFRIFATVAAIMQEFSRERQDVEEMYFSITASGKGGVALENIYIKMLDRYFKNWHVERDAEDYFVLTRKSR